MSLINPAEFANIRASEEHFWWYRGMRAILFRFLTPHLEGRDLSRALEAGCGTGYLSHLLQKERGWSIVPLDYSADGLGYARRLGVANPVQGDIRALPFADGHFDLTMSLDVLTHLPAGEEHLAAREMARVTRPRGRIVALEITRVAIPVWGGIFGLYFRRVVPALGAVVARDRHAYTYLPASVDRFLTARELAVAMERAG